ncbi:hypothetical protein ANCCEY_15917, partial [Ancylostoma ceylanicum]
MAMSLVSVHAWSRKVTFCPITTSMFSSQPTASGIPC